MYRGAAGEFGRTLEVAEAALIDTHMTSVWVQWGPGGVTFKLWMFFR